MSTGSRAEFSRLLCGGYGYILRMLWWMRWPILGLVGAMIAIKIIKH
jgi:hypothetical protein